MSDVCVGRQPIFDLQRRVVGWELLFRNANGVRGDIVDGNAATAQTIVNSLVEIGLENLAPSGEPVYLNCTREFLDQDPIFPPDRCVLEILEDIPITAGLLEAIDRLRSLDYRIALDDFVYEPHLAPLVQRAHIIKLDVMALGLAGLATQVRALSPFGVCLLAEKIDSERELAACHRMGCELFQGYYLRRPDTLSARSASTNKLSALMLLGECQKENANLARIAEILASDPGLSFKTLQLANSAIFGTHEPIASLRQAIATIGLNSLARWAALLVLAGLENCPSSYLERALERAYMCEMLADRFQVAESTAYLTGLLSIFDAAMAAPFSELVSRLPVNDDIKEALAGRTGDLGRLLTAVTSYQGGELAADTPVASHLLEHSFWKACNLAHETALRFGLRPQNDTSPAPAPR